MTKVVKVDPNFSTSKWRRGGGGKIMDFSEQSAGLAQVQGSLGRRYNVGVYRPDDICIVN